MIRLIICILFWTLTTNAQTSYVDSLINSLQLDIPQKSKIEAKFLLAEYLVQRNPELAEQYANELNAYSDIPRDSSEWGRLNSIYAASHRWQGNYKTALEYYASNYGYYSRHNDSLKIAETAKFIGSINMFLGNNIIAQEYLIACSDIYMAIGSDRQKASINTSLGSFYLNIDQIEKGKEKYLQALDDFKTLNDSAGMSGVHANLGMVYTDLGEYDKAQAHLMKQKAFNKVFPTLREMGFHHDFLGNLRQAQGRLEEAYDEHLIGLNIRKDLSSTYNLCESKLNVGEVLIKLGRYKEAIEQLEDVLEYEEHESFNQQYAAHNLLSEAYEKKGDYKSALAHYKTFKQISDTIYNENSIQVIAEKDALYKKKEQDARIELLNAQYEVTQTKLQRSRTIIVSSLVGLSIFSLLSVFIYLMYKKIKAKNITIKKALADKSLLMDEIHHRVKNNLQMISSLLQLQSRFITDKTALDAINAGRSRVQSMAILHKNLYREENLTGVNMKEYFNNLIQGIFNSYNLTHDQIKLNLDIDDIQLDVDAVIPIGLITNELITNSLKYAFEDAKEHASIQVKLKESLNNYELVVRDNGVGMSVEIINRKPDKTFGQRMIHAFVNKLKATMRINNTNGTEVIISIPKLA